MSIPWIGVARKGEAIAVAKRPDAPFVPTDEMGGSERTHDRPLSLDDEITAPYTPGLEIQHRQRMRVMRSIFQTGRGLLLAVLCGAGAMQAKAQLKECKVGVRVQNKEGRFGTITKSVQDYCYVTYDDTHKEEMVALIWWLRPAADAQPEKPAAALTEGEYDCASASGGAWSHPGIMAMGRMDIRGLTYRFRPFGKVSQGFAPYAVGPDGSLKWGGKMGGLDLSPSVILASRKIPWDAFKIDYRTKPGAFSETMSCKLMKK